MSMDVIPTPLTFIFFRGVGQPPTRDMIGDLRNSQDVEGGHPLRLTNLQNGPQAASDGYCIYWQTYR